LPATFLLETLKGRDHLKDLSFNKIDLRDERSDDMAWIHLASVDTVVKFLFQQDAGNFLIS
jgi:hypothetical protein